MMESIDWIYKGIFKGIFVSKGMNVWGIIALDVLQY